MPVSKENSKLALFSQFARIGKALSNPNRLQLMELLAQGERGVDALAKVAGLSTANASQHLQQLKQAGLVNTRKVGLNVYYVLSGDDVLELFLSVRQVAQRHLGDVDRILDSLLGNKDDLEPVRAKDLLTRTQDGSVTVLDVRPAQEYAAGHVPNAINVPMSELQYFVKNLPKTQEVVAYCRGPHCVLAFDAVNTLREQGFIARRLEDGFPEWKLAGLPVER